MGSQTVTIELHDGSRLTKVVKPRDSFSYNRQTEMFVFNFEYSAISVPRESVKFVTQEQLI